MNNKNDISWRGIVIGIVIFLGIIYVFSFDNISFGGYFRFTLAMTGVVLLCGALIAFFFGLLPAIFSFVGKHAEKFLNNYPYFTKNNISKNVSLIVGGTSAIFAFLLLIVIVIFLDENNYFDKINWILDNYLFR